MKKVILALIILLSISYNSYACSMYKITKNGKTIVGNNEDWLSPNSQFWFVPGEDGNYGVMNVGLLDRFAQGAINEAGLVFDGFANPYLEVKNIEGKVNIRIGDAVENAMKTFNNVRDVKKYFSNINLSSLSTMQLVFVDKSGEYLIIEGDELIIGDEAEKTFSNFYYSQIESINEVELKNVQNGLKYLQNSESEESLDYCSNVMKNLSNPDGFTQYSTIYDLDKLTIRVYLYHDYSKFVDLDLKSELKKESHDKMIADLFPVNTIGHEHYLMYNDKKNPTSFIDFFIGEKSRTETNLVKNGFSSNINVIGYEWLYSKNDPKGAIEIFKYATELMPNEANLFDSLGEAYYTDGNHEDAIKSYANSLRLNTDNDNAIQMLERIRQERIEIRK